MDRLPDDVDPQLVPIEDYAVLGDGRTAALVSLRGSIDWMCLPTFDSAACFARLLGTRENGRWLLTVRDASAVTRRYLDDSFVLETTYEAAHGTAVVLETMPLHDGRSDLVRRIQCTRGHVEVEHEWIVRFGYGDVEPWVRRLTDQDGNDAIRAIAGPDSLLLRGDRLPRPTDHRHGDRFTLHEGESVELALTWTRSWDPVVPRQTIEDRIDATRITWGLWARSCAYQGSYREAVVRSLLVLRLLTDQETGGIVAAATTSLPEDFGGERNWDYRYCWLRDAAMTLEALLEHGYRDEATEWRDWLLRAVAGNPADLQIMYRVDGGRHLPEHELDHLAGYSGARPVRVGNAAVGQVQNDVLGEVMCALDQARAAGLAESADSWSLQRHLVEELLSRWREPDRGIWEVRGAPQHFTHSKVMAWAAVDRAVRAVEQHGLDGPVERWRAERDAIHADVLAHGWNAERGTFVQSYGADHTDASLLQIAQVDFLPSDDPRILSTLAAIRAELEIAPGLLRRYRTEHTDDGLAGDEHAFLACSFWLADALARADDVEGSTQVLDVLVGLTNDVGLLAEQYDPVGRRMAGNLPQALSHLALVRAVHSHDLALERRNRMSDEVVVLDEVEIRRLSVGPMDNNAYLLTCRRAGAQLLVDAAAEPDRLLAMLREASASAALDVVVTTHRHRPDHLGALESIVAVTGATVAAGAADAEAIAAAADVHVRRRLRDGDQITVGHLVLDVIGLRGHTPGSVALAYTEPGGRSHLFTGDSLFPGGVGKTSGPHDFTQLFGDVVDRVFDRFGDDTVVYPGHGATTTLGTERPHLPQWRERGW